MEIFLDLALTQDLSLHVLMIRRKLVLEWWQL